mgnify:FL=1
MSMIHAYQGTCEAFVQAVKEYNPSMLKKKKVHLLLHLPDTLHEFGPTSAYNTERYTNWHFIRYTNTDMSMSICIGVRHLTP